MDKTRTQYVLQYQSKKENKNGPDQGHWSHIQTLCTACPTLAHCHSGLVSLWQPQPLTQDLDCLKEKRRTNTNVEIITEYHSYGTLLFPNVSNSRHCFWLNMTGVEMLLLIVPEDTRGWGWGADIPLCVAMTVILCHCSCSRSNSITVLIKPVSEAMRNRASGSDWGSTEYLRYRNRAGAEIGKERER